MPQIPEDIEALNRKINVLKAKNAARNGREDKHTDLSRLSVGLRLGIELASGTVVGAAIGYMLDELFDFKFMMLLILTIFGGFAGMLNAYRYVKNLNAAEGEKRG